VSVRLRHDFMTNVFSSPNIFFLEKREEMETGREEIDPFEDIDDPTHILHK
jgi:hypothetical protein